MLLLSLMADKFRLPYGHWPKSAVLAYWSRHRVIRVLHFLLHCCLFVLRMTWSPLQHWPVKSLSSGLEKEMSWIATLPLASLILIRLTTRRRKASRFVGCGRILLRKWTWMEWWRCLLLTWRSSSPFRLVACI